MNTSLKPKMKYYFYKGNKIHCKKGYGFPSPAGVLLTKLSVAWNY